MEETVLPHGSVGQEMGDGMEIHSYCHGFEMCSSFLTPKASAEGEFGSIHNLLPWDIELVIDKPEQECGVQVWTPFAHTYFNLLYVVLRFCLTSKDARRCGLCIVSSY